MTGVDAAIVAYYGATTDPVLDRQVAVLQDLVADRLGDGFAPRPIAGVHSTLIGLDSLGPWADEPDVRASDAVRAAVDAIAAWDGWPLTLQLGGFPDRDLAVVSRGARPFDRSLAILGDQVVLLGWPVDPAGEPTHHLAELRRGLEALGVVHRYGRDDADAHLVLGELTEPLDQQRSRDLLDGGRRWLLRSPVQVALAPQHLSVVVYTDTTLPAATTGQIAWSDLRGGRPQSR